MEDYSKYDLSLEKYQGKLPSYLQTPGSIIMNQIQLYYDIINSYKETLVDIWKHFDIDTLITEYFIWKDKNPLLEDSEWKYTDLVEKICKTYDIIREHPVDGGTLLKNSHMLRLLKIRIMGVGFDGTREKLDLILNTLFPSGSNVEFAIKTRTEKGKHATADIYMIKATGALVDDIDVALFEEGYYFLKLLGITLNFTAVPINTLVYDNTVYDTVNEYDNGGTV